MSEYVGSDAKWGSVMDGLYSTPLPASRRGSLFSAFSYPTKISPESIAVFIASHTKPGDTVLDVFGGSGTMGLAAMLCANPPCEVIDIARQLKAPVQWGPRNAIIYELSTLGAFVAQTMAYPPDPHDFVAAAKALIARCEARLAGLYAAKAPDGHPGEIRYAIWTEILECPHCGTPTTFWDAAVHFEPLRLEGSFRCTVCGRTSLIAGVARSEEAFYDPILQACALRRRRAIAMIYGRSGKNNWKRRATAEDVATANRAIEWDVPTCAPVVLIPWGDLHRSGYHTGITHAHHFYTVRNWLAMAVIWDEIERAPGVVQDALRLLALSYNAAHATLMTRIVVKQGQGDFVLTGAQPGVLYVSSLPVEKNLFAGLRRKANVLKQAFASLRNSRSSVRVINASSRHLDLPDRSVDYIFTDPPFGGFIPYAEVNFLNEVWLGRLTDRAEEIIISDTQGKSVDHYGSLMADVFAEMARVLKDDGCATVVFHSARADVWRALQDAHVAAGLHVERSSVLDKLQGSFKQVTSMVSVKGDPLLLLVKSPARNAPTGKSEDVEAMILELMAAAAKTGDEKEGTPERLFSRFVARCMERGISVSIDAAEFYNRTRGLMSMR